MVLSVGPGKTGQRESTGSSPLPEHTGGVATGVAEEGDPSGWITEAGGGEVTFGQFLDLISASFF